MPAIPLACPHRPAPRPWHLAWLRLGLLGLILPALLCLAACGQKGPLYLPEPKPEATQTQAPKPTPDPAPAPEPVAPTESGESLEVIDSLPDPGIGDITSPDLLGD